MQQYDLGPNGALVMANDLIASKIDDIQNEVNRVNLEFMHLAWKKVLRKLPKLFLFFFFGNLIVVFITLS